MWSFRQGTLCVHTLVLHCALLLSVPGMPQHWLWPSSAPHQCLVLSGPQISAHLVIFQMGLPRLRPLSANLHVPLPDALLRLLSNYSSQNTGSQALGPSLSCHWGRQGPHIRNLPTPVADHVCQKELCRLQQTAGGMHSLLGERERKHGGRAAPAGLERLQRRTGFVLGTEDEGHGPGLKMASKGLSCHR